MELTQAYQGVVIYIRDSKKGGENIRFYRQSERDEFNAEVRVGQNSVWGSHWFDTPISNMNTLVEETKRQTAEEIE